MGDLLVKREYSKGVIINTLAESSYIKWIEPFVMTVLEKSGIRYKETIIDSMEGGKRIFLLIDGIEYTIRTWNFEVTKNDLNNRPCAAMIDYTLFKEVNGENHYKEIFEGFEEVEL